MNNKVINIAIIGCGRIAGHHCRSIQKVDGIKLVAVCDLDDKKACQYGHDFNAKHYTNYRKMLEENPEIDVVAVITPSGMHYEHAMEILSKFNKNIIIEKPTFMKPSQVVAAFDFAEKAGIKIFPVFQNRNNLAVKRVSHSIKNGELGQIRTIAVRMRWCREQTYYGLSPWRGKYSHDGGALTNQGIHYIDVMRFLGGEVNLVNAMMGTLGADIQVEDTVVATLANKNGSLGVVEITTAARPRDFEASVSLVCEKGLAQIGGIAVNELQVFTPNPSDCQKFSEDFKGNVYGNGHVDIYRQILDDFRGNSKYPIDRDDCLGSIKLLHAFYRSDEIRGAVDMNEPEMIESSRLGMPDESISKIYRI